MQVVDGKVVFSASDLNNYLACEHLSSLDYRAAFEGNRPTDKSPEAELLSALGEEHEAAYLSKLQDDGKQIVEISADLSLAEKAEATEKAMRDGVYIIYQATFFHDGWRGHADFLRRRESASKLGAWSYEVADTKLARKAKPYFILQLCFYSEQVERIQGCAPEFMHVILGDGREEPFRVNDFSAYYRHVKKRFLANIGNGTQTYPDPVDHCGLCVWNEGCAGQRERDDHLSLVAGATRYQRRRLNDAGIRTLEELGTATGEQRPETIARPIFEKLNRQARLQLEQRRRIARGDADPYVYELLDVEPEAKRGFALLPPPSAGDIFFDMEGDPYFEIGEGLEYLFGVYTQDKNQPYRVWWGCKTSVEASVTDRLAEKRAFEAFMDFVAERLKQYPDLHIYHYASYEKSVIKKLSQRHGTRENERDDLLRKEILVDLHRVVRQAVCASQPNYKLKTLEAYYMKRRAALITAGEQSIVEFERWRQTRDEAGAPDDTILENIRLYNEEDCRSTLLLRDWLLRLRDEAIRKFATPIPLKTEIIKADPIQINERRADIDAMKQQLVADVPEDFDPYDLERLPEKMRARWMLAQLLDYHAREVKPVWWAFYDRCDTFDDDPHELVNDGEAIGEISTNGIPATVDGNFLIHTLHFPAQQHKLKPGRQFDPATRQQAGEVLEIDDDAGTIRLRRGRLLKNIPPPQALVPRKTYKHDAQEAALMRFAGAVMDGSVEQHQYCALWDILLRNVPRLRDRPIGASIQTGDANLPDIKTAVENLDASYLFIQGPPGSGKTYSGARLVTHLMAKGKTVGVTSNSHKAIQNLLHEVESAAVQEGRTFRGLQKFTAGEEESQYVSRLPRPFITTESGSQQFPTDAIQLYAGTAWLFATERMNATLDYLFIDEAGQVSLADALAMGTAARNVVLLGDPLQLAQVSQGAHLDGVGDSVLEHLLGDYATIPPERGIFLEHTYRMHPDVCTFVSDVVYDERLEAAPECANQRVDSAGISGTGLRYVPIDHEGNKQQSPEEAERIANEIALLLDGTVTDMDGVTRPVRPSDIMVVTPYNAQVRCLKKHIKERVGVEIPVGTVDKFQGQEAYAVFFSMATSTGEDIARNLDFLFSRNRLNVAVSRARALAILVASPALLEVQCNSTSNMKLLNALCRFIELAPRD
ncbi:MAG: TM0106 family RecB-like putative nuclease [Candidatus Eremiobacteraeota bacterium]|nr:TM0106 family RecB-like putative nuclease [Candidatus Eremiobacteraeota bacterium]